MVHFEDEDALFLAIYEHVAGKTHGFTADEELRIAEAVHQAALDEGVDPFLVLAVIHVESSFIKGQRSRVGALGLMQVKPSTAEAFADAAGVRWRGPRTLFDIESNIRIGTRYLAFKLERFGGDEVLALAAYCHGPTRIRRILREDGALDLERQGYSHRVLRMHRHYRGRSGLPVG
jgi:soluble lytic murein transglycosylase